MKVKVAVAVLALAVVPGIAAAQCGWEKTQQSASQCPQGHSWDEGTQSCVAPVSS